MTTSSRTRNSIKNSSVALLYYVLYLVLTFFSRKVFLDYLGADILGLNTTAQNLLQFLNLAELGIGVGVGFTLYKPLYEGDEKSVNEIVTLQGQLYKRIALLIFGTALILMLFFPLIFEKISLPLWYTYAVFGVLLFSSLLGYFVNYRQIVLTASQKDYKVQYSSRTVFLLKILFQMAAVRWLADGFVWWIALEGIFAVIQAISLHKMTMKEFPGLKSVNKSFRELRAQYSSFVTKIKQIFFHKLGAFVLTQSSPLVIYAYTSLTTVAIYGNYLIIVSGLTSMINAVFNSIGAGVGNLIAEGNYERIKRVFSELFSIRFLIVATLSFCLFMLSNPFVVIWIGAEYLLPEWTVLLIACLLFINLSRLTVDSFINAYGLFSDIWAPVIESILNIGLSVCLGAFYGLNGILCGVLISQIVIILGWKPYYLISRRMPHFGKEYLFLFVSHLILFGIISSFCYYIFRGMEYEPGLLSFIINATIIFSTFLTLMTISLLVINPDLRNGIRKIFQTITNKATSRQ